MNENRLSIRRFLPPWLNGLWGGIAIFSALYVLAYLGWIAFHWGGEENVTLIGDLFYLPLDLMTMVILFRTARRPELSQRARRAWWLLGLSIASYFLADLSWAYIENVLNEPPFPSIADVFYLAFIPLTLVALLNLADPMRARRKYDHQRYWSDLVITALAATILVWHFVVADTLIENTGDLTVLLFAVAYPMGDLILITGLLAVWLRHSEPNTRSVLGWVLLALICFIGSDLAFAYTSLQGTYSSGSWVDAGWALSYLFLELAALRQPYQAPSVEASPWGHRLDQFVRWALSGVVVLALGLVVYLGLVNGFGGAELSWLTVGVLLIVIFLGWRFVGTRGFADLSLGNKLISSFLIVTLIPIVGIVYYDTVTARRNLTDNANTILRSSASQTAASLDGFISDGLINVRTASQSYIWEEYLSLPPAERTGSQLEYAVNIDLRAIARRDQIFIDAVGLMDKNGIDVADTASGEVGSNKSTHKYVAEPLRTGLPSSTIQFSPSTNNLSVYFSAPIRDTNGNILGVLRIRYKAEVLQQIITQSAANLGLKGLEIILLDENHIRLADSDTPDLILTSIVPLPADRLAQLQAERRLPSDQPIEQFSTNLPELDQGLSNAVNQPIFTALTHPDELKHEQIAVAPMDSQPWLVAVAQEQSIYLAPIATQTRTAGLTVLVFAVLAALAAVAMAKIISTPIVQLRNVANQIADGNLQAEAPVHSRDEIGTLATAFNSMTGQLRISFEKLDRRAAELATVADVGTATSTILDVEQLLQNVVELAKERFNLYHAHIYLLDEAGENLVLASGAGEPGRQMVSKGHSIPLNREISLVARAARERQGVTVNDVTQAPDFLPNPLLPDTRSELAVPMVVGGHVIGVFDVQSDVVGRFTESDINIQNTLASQVAASLQNVRQYESSRKIAADLEVVANVGLATSAITEASRLLQEVVDLAKKSFNFYHAHIYLLNKAEDTLDLAAGAGEVGRQMVAEGWNIPIDHEHSIVARAARSRQSVISNDIIRDTDSQFLSNRLLPDTRSEMAVPLIVGDTVLGVFDVQADTPGRFTEDDIRIQTTLAAQVSIAVQNARTLVRAQHQAERESTLNTISQKIQSATTVEAVLQIAARELGHALGAPMTMAQLSLKNQS